MITWEQLYDLLGIRDFIYFISSTQLQERLFGVKFIFAVFTMFFLGAVIYFMIVSSWLKYQFVEDVSEFFSWHAYGRREISRFWTKIKKKMDSGIESELKLAVIEADDFLVNMLEQAGYEGKDFGEIVNKAGKAALPNLDEVLAVHEERNSIVYDPGFKIDAEKIKKILSVYEVAINSAVS